MFSVYNNPVRVSYAETAVFSANADKPVLEGVELIDALLPVSALTGSRENPLTLLSLGLKPSQERLAAQLLQEIQSDNSITAPDDIDASMVASRLELGTFAERDAFDSHLASIADVLLANKQSVSVPDATPSDSSSVSAADSGGASE